MPRIFSLLLLLVAPLLLSLASAVDAEKQDPVEVVKNMRKLRKNTAGLDLKKQDVAAADGVSAESSQRKLQSELITYKCHCNTVFGFNLKDNALPVTTDAEVLEVLRLTEVRERGHAICFYASQGFCLFL